MDLTRLTTKLRSEAVITALSASFLLSFTLFFFGPSTQYYTNIYEFYYTFSDILPWLLSLTIIIGVSLSCGLVFFTGRYHQKIVCLVFSFALLFYIQGNILVWNYGPLDGREIIWNHYLINGIIESLVWVVIISVFFFKAEKIYKFVTLVSLFLIVIQISGFIALVNFAPSEPAWKSYSFENADSQFVFSDKENVIIIILDTFQSDVFQEIINEDESYRKKFDGFTYYRNAVGGYPHTAASVPLILTGTYYKNEMPFNSFVQQSINNSSLPKTLINNGFIVNIHGNTVISPSKNIASNVVGNTLDYNEKLNILYRITLFRFIPHFIKEITFSQLIVPDVYDEWKTDLNFSNNITNKIKIVRTPVFQYYHLNGPHYPFFLNETIEYEKLPNTRNGYKEQSKASLQIVNKLLNVLKKNGIYDQSLIIIVGDHGMQEDAYGINTTQLTQKNFVTYTPDTIISGGIPLVLVKPSYSNASLAISDAPVSLSDIPKTVASELELPNSFCGTSIMNIRESDIRDRTHYYYPLVNENRTGDFLAPMNEYLITNFSWYGNSWQPLYKVYSSQGVYTQNPPEYIVNSTIKMGKNEGTGSFTTVGWSNPAEYYVWSVEKTATIAFTMNKTDSDLILKMTLFPLRFEKIYETQRVFVYFNKKEIGNFTLSKNGESEKVLFISHELQNDNVQYLSFIFPDAKSPYDLGVSDDKRKISIGLTSFSLENVDQDRIYFDDKWSPVENWSGTDTRWMDDNASLIIYSDNNHIANLTLQCMSFNRTRILNVRYNAQNIKTENVLTTFNPINIPIQLYKGENRIMLSVSGKCDRPADIPGQNSSDTRCLGLAFQEIKIL